MTDIIKGAIQLLRSHNCPFLDPFPIFEKETDPLFSKETLVNGVKYVQC